MNISKYQIIPSVVVLIALGFILGFTLKKEEANSFYTYTDNYLKHDIDSDKHYYSDHKIVRNNIFQQWLVKAMKQNKVNIYMAEKFSFPEKFTQKVMFEELKEALTKRDTFFYTDANTLEELTDVIITEPDFESTYKIGVFQSWDFKDASTPIESYIDSIIMFDESIDQYGPSQFRCMIKFE